MSPETLDNFLSGENGIFSADAQSLESEMSQQQAPDRLHLHARFGTRATRAAMLDELSRTFDMPRWFGHNWDALEDCLTDLEWLPEGPIVLFVEGSAERGEDAAMLCDILENACAEWQAMARQFHVVMDARLTSPEP